MLDPVPDNPDRLFPLIRIPLLILDRYTVLNAGRTVTNDLEAADVGFPTIYAFIEVDINAVVALLIAGS